jgi:hypothetical protein
MELIYNKVFLKHDTGSHPENKRRLESFEELKETPILNGEEYFGPVHFKQYIYRVREACENPMAFTNALLIL